MLRIDRFVLCFVLAVLPCTALAAQPFGDKSGRAELDAISKLS
jgi:hypothetical protein